MVCVSSQNVEKLTKTIFWCWFFYSFLQYLKQIKMTIRQLKKAKLIETSVSIEQKKIHVFVSNRNDLLDNTKFDEKHINEIVV